MSRRRLRLEVKKCSIAAERQRKGIALLRSCMGAIDEEYERALKSGWPFMPAEGIDK